VREPVGLRPDDVCVFSVTVIEEEVPDDAPCRRNLELDEECEESIDDDISFVLAGSLKLARSEEISVPQINSKSRLRVKTPRSSATD
jgi:hypothetical protein